MSRSERQPSDSFDSDSYSLSSADEGHEIRQSLSTHAQAFTQLMHLMDLNPDLNPDLNLWHSTHSSQIPVGLALHPHDLNADSPSVPKDDQTHGKDPHNSTPHRLSRKDQHRAGFHGSKDPMRRTEMTRGSCVDLEMELRRLCAEAILVGFVICSHASQILIDGGCWDSTVHAERKGCPSAHSIHAWFQAVAVADGADVFQDSFNLGARRYRIFYRTPMEIRAVSDKRIFGVYARRLSCGYFVCIHTNKIHYSKVYEKIYEVLIGLMQ